MEKCNCQPVCDDCKCSPDCTHDCIKTLDISTPHFRNQFVEEDADYTVDNYAETFAEPINIDPDGGHRQILSYSTTKSAFAFSEPSDYDYATESDENEKRNPDDLVSQYEKIANRRFSDYIATEFDTFEPAHLYQMQSRLREVRTTIQPSKESLRSLNDTLSYINKILSIEPSRNTDMQILLHLKMTRDELTHRRDWIVSVIARVETRIADLFNEKARLETLLDKARSDGSFGEIAAEYTEVFDAPPSNAEKLIFGIRYIEGMTVGVVADKSGNKLFTKVDFISPFDKYDIVVAFARLFADYKTFDDNKIKQ